MRAAMAGPKFSAGAKHNNGMGDRTVEKRSTRLAAQLFR
jgi:hypothetical protein